MRLILLSLISAALLAQVPALEGLDPVELTQGKETPGDAAITAKHGRYLYRFASQQSRAAFEKDPAQYAIQLGGACARMGPPVGSNPDAWFVYKGRIYAFGSQECYKLFTANPAAYLASEQPRPAFKSTPESKAQAKTLLAKAIEAAGGSGKVSAIRSYVETRAVNNSTVTLSFQLPGSFHSETERTNFRFATLLSPKGAFSIFRDQRNAIQEDFVPLLRENLSRDLLPLLLAKDEADSTGPHTLLIRDTQLHLDPQSGRIAALSYRGRGSDAAYGEIRIAYSDYRDVSGVMLPFKATVTCDGKEEPARSWTTKSFALNPEGIDARFQ